MEVHAAAQSSWDNFSFAVAFVLINPSSPWLLGLMSCGRCFAATVVLLVLALEDALLPRMLSLGGCFATVRGMRMFSHHLLGRMLCHHVVVWVDVWPPLVLADALPPFLLL